MSCTKKSPHFQYPSPDQMPGYYTRNEPKRSSAGPSAVVDINIYREVDRNEKYWIKNAGERSILCISQIFILLVS